MKQLAIIALCFTVFSAAMIYEPPSIPISEYYIIPDIPNFNWDDIIDSSIMTYIVLALFIIGVLPIG